MLDVSCFPACRCPTYMEQPCYGCGTTVWLLLHVCAIYMKRTRTKPAATMNSAVPPRAVAALPLPSKLLAGCVSFSLLSMSNFFQLNLNEELWQNIIKGLPLH